MAKVLLEIDEVKIYRPPSYRKRQNDCGHTPTGTFPAHQPA